jgi:hypothetical protein
MPTWNTASDWDSATAESGVVYESVANTDHNDDTVVKRGYSAQNPYNQSSLIVYLPFHENSGTAYDFSGNNNDGIVSGVNQGVSTFLENDGYRFGDTDYVELDGIPTVDDSSGSFTYTTWIKPTGGGRGNIFHPRLEADHRWEFDVNGSNEVSFLSYDGSSTHVYTNTSLTLDTWYFIAVTWNNGSVQHYVNGNTDGSGSLNGWYTPNNRAGNWIGYVDERDENDIDADMFDFRVYDYELSSSEIQSLYDVGATNGTLTTAWKSP